MVSGSCLCGSVAFEIEGKLTPIQYCHATRCRKATGSAFAAEVAALTSAFRWTRGEDLITVYEAPLLREPPPYRHAFCRVCGSPLPVPLEGTDFVVLHAGVLDAEPETRPFRHIFVGQKAPWHTITDEMPQFEQHDRIDRRIRQAVGRQSNELDQEGVMIKLYHSPRSRSVRIVWLLEELGVPYELQVVPFTPPLPPAKPFAQRSPFGKVPALEDDDLTMIESGAILEYILERYGQGRLAPAPGTPLRGVFLQWVHFAEATAFPPLGNIAWHSFKQDADSIPGAMADYRGWAEAALDTLERALAGKEYLLGHDFSGADIMMGYTLKCAKWFGILDQRYPSVTAYLERLESRTAFQKALAS